MVKTNEKVRESFGNLPSVTFLQKKQIPFSLFTHPSPPQTLTQAASERGQVPGQVVRSILFRLSEEVFVMALAPGPDQISWNKLRKYLRVSRVTMADRDEVFNITGSYPGAVSPLGIPGKIRILADPHLLDHKEVSLGSGIPGVAIIIQSGDLIKAIPSLEFCDLFSCREEKPLPDETQS